MAKASAANKDPDAGLEKLTGTLEEIKVYLCFCFALISLFDQVNAESVYKKLDAGTVFTRMANARQWMSVNRAAALETIRLVQQLPFPPPGPVVVV
jgi:hypothetical protein